MSAAIRREADGWRLGDDPGPAWAIGVFEGAGATLWWPAGHGAPGGLVWDAAAAAGWIDAVWPGTTDALAAAGAFGAGVAPHEQRSEAVTAGDADGPLADAARRAALAGWRAAWWPASRIAGIPPLDPRLVAAERLIALAEADGALDGEAIERAAEAYGAAVAALGPAAPESSSASDLIRLADEVAAEHGADAAATAAAPMRAEDYALAAAGERAAAALASGSARVDPASLPQGVVDPAGEVSWSVALGAEGASLAVSVPAAPQFGDAPVPEAALRARVADAEVGLRLEGEAWRGEAAVAPSFLALPPERRAAALLVPGFEPDADPAATHEHAADGLIRIAEERLAAPESDSEREAR